MAKELTGLTSALTSAQKKTLGDSVATNYSEQEEAELFGDLDYEPDTPAPASDPGQSSGTGSDVRSQEAGQPQAQEPEAAPTPDQSAAEAPDDNGELEDEGAEEQTGDAEEEAEAATEAEGEEVAATTPASGEKIEVSDEEYGFLKTQPVDDLIAKMVSHRKGKATLDSKLGKIENTIGPELIKAIDGGEDVTGIKQLLVDLPDEAFQQHLADFYDSHALTDGKYKRTKERVPTVDALEEYTKLVAEKATLKAMDFLDNGEEFNADDAFSDPASPSGRALTKLNNRTAEIERELEAIRTQSSAAETSTAEANASGTAALQEQQHRWNDLVSTHKELNKAERLQDFRTFLRENANNMLELVYAGYLQRNSNKKKMRTLIVKEMDAIAENRQSATNGSGGGLPKKVTKVRQKQTADPEYGNVFS